MSTVWPRQVKPGDLIPEHTGHGPVHDVKPGEFLHLVLVFADGHHHPQPTHRRVHVANR